MILTILTAWACVQEPVWTDDAFDDTRGKLSGLRVLADRALSLESDVAKLQYLCAPSKYDVITDMTLYRGRLFASSSFRITGPMGYSASAQILEALPSGEWKVARDVPKTMLLNLRVVADRLSYACFSGPTDDVGIFDGAEWTTLVKLPQPMLHGMDVCGYKGKLYWSGALRPRAVPELRQGVGAVFESADDGKTWKEIYLDKEPGRVQDMVVMKDRLYANRRGVSLLCWDGSTWKDIPVGVPTKPGEKAFLGDGLLTVFKDAILAASLPLYYRFDGEKWTSHTPGFLRLFVDGDRVLGLRGDGHVYESADGTTWKRITKIGVPAEEFSLTKVHTLRRGSVASFGGRLYVGTGVEGKIYASPFAATGAFTSKVRPISSGTRLTWDAEVPRGATFAVSVRTAPSEKGFADSEWRAVDDPLTVPAGHRFLQYQAAFTSDGASTPVLRAVRWLP